MRKVFQVCAFVAAQMLLLSPSHAQTRDISVHGDLLDRIAAIVNDGLVLKSELDQQMTSVEKRLQEQKVELPSQSVLQQQVLDRLVLQEIQLQRAKHVGLTITDEQLNGALQEIAARNKIPFDQLPTALQAQGVDYKAYRESMRKELTLSTLRQRDVIAHINVSPHELEQYLAREQNAAANDELIVSHILLSLPARPRRSSSTIFPIKRPTWPRGRERARTSANSPLRTRTAKRPWTAVHSDGARARSCRNSFWIWSSK